MVVELSIGRAGGWYYPLYRLVGCRRWRWSVVGGKTVRFASEAEVKWFLWALCERLMEQQVWCCVLAAGLGGDEADGTRPVVRGILNSLKSNGRRVAEGREGGCMQ